MDPTWQHPFTCLVSGPTACGKTQWVMNFIDNITEMMNPVPSRVVYSYSEWQPSYANLPSYVELQEGLCHIPENSNQPMLLIIDDQMNEVNKDVMRLFTKGSHHRNISVIYIVQNLFYSNKDHRTISLNAHYLVLFNNPRDRSQIINLGKQMCPGEIEYVKESFDLATREPHGYLLVDLKQTTPRDLRFRGRIFPREKKEVYVRRNAI